MISFAAIEGRPGAGMHEVAQRYYLGRGALAHEDWHAARLAFEDAITPLRERAEWRLLWLCYIGLTTTTWRTASAAAALAYAREALALAEHLENPWARFWSLWLSGHLYAEQLQFAEAGRCFQALAELLDGADEDQRTLRHLSVVATLLCGSEGTRPESRTAALSRVAALAAQIGKRQGLPLEALDGLEHAPQPPQSATSGVASPWELAGEALVLPPRQEATAWAARSAPALPTNAGKRSLERPDQDSPHALRVRCLGRFEVHVGQTPLTEWAGSKSKALLKLLASAYPSTVSATVLMSTIWEGVDEELARQRMHTALSDLRRALRTAHPAAAGLIIAQNGSYGLDPRAGIWVDILAFEEATRAGRHYEQLGRRDEAQTAYREAVALYRGEFLEEDRYEDWPLERRERLRREYLTLLTTLSQWALAAEDYTACIEWAQRLLSCDPCREDAHRLLMRCYSRLGQRTLALRQYRQCVDALRRELGAIPETATEELYRQLQQGQAV